MTDKKVDMNEVKRMMEIMKDKQTMAKCISGLGMMIQHISAMFCEIHSVPNEKKQELIDAMKDGSFDDNEEMKQHAIEQGEKLHILFQMCESIATSTPSELVQGAMQYVDVARNKAMKEEGEGSDTKTVEFEGETIPINGIPFRGKGNA